MKVTLWRENSPRQAEGLIFRNVVLRVCLRVLFGEVGDMGISANSEGEDEGLERSTVRVRRATIANLPLERAIIWGMHI